jgi:hypothetical protein
MKATNIFVIPDTGTVKGGELYDKFGNLSYFADVDGLEDKTTTGQDLAVSVSAHSTNSFMGDPAPSSVRAHTRYLSTGLRRSKGGYPGYPVTLSDGTETRDFSYTGTMSGLVAWLKTTAKVDINLFGPTGTPYDTIPTVSAG